MEVPPSHVVTEAHSGSSASGKLADDAPRNVYIASLPLEFSDRQLYELASRFGNIASHRMFTDTKNVSQTGHAYGFVLFTTAAAAAAAVAGLSDLQVGDRRLQVRLSKNGIVKKRRSIPGGAGGDQPEAVAYPGLKSPSSSLAMSSTPSSASNLSRAPTLGHVDVPVGVGAPLVRAPANASLPPAAAINPIAISQWPLPLAPPSHHGHSLSQPWHQSAVVHQPIHMVSTPYLSPSPHLTLPNPSLHHHHASAQTPYHPAVASYGGLHYAYSPPPLPASAGPAVMLGGPGPHHHHHHHLPHHYHHHHHQHLHYPHHHHQQQLVPYPPYSLYQVPVSNPFPHAALPPT
jgi:RNA recognition motif-containing protein